jgi:hypothetical protein
MLTLHRHGTWWLYVMSEVEKAAASCQDFDQESVRADNEPVNYSYELRQGNPAIRMSTVVLALDGRFHVLSGSCSHATPMSCLRRLQLSNTTILDAAVSFDILQRLLKLWLVWPHRSLSSMCHGSARRHTYRELVYLGYLGS